MHKKSLPSDLEWLQRYAIHPAVKSNGSMWAVVETSEGKNPDDPDHPVEACVHYCPQTGRPTFARIGVREDNDWKPDSTFDYVYSHKTKHWRGVD